MKHHNLGLEGELIASEYLAGKGYQILERNWRYRKLEVDLIAEYEGELVFVEVKLRSAQVHGNPRDFVGKTKQSNLIKAADAYVEKMEIDKNSRFDIIGISMRDQPYIEHIIDAFHT
jgi:putative endonuclease